MKILLDDGLGNRDTRTRDLLFASNAAKTLRGLGYDVRVRPDGYTIDHQPGSPGPTILWSLETNDPVLADTVIVKG